MEGDAGASRLNPIDEDDPTGSEDTTEATKVDEAVADATDSEAPPEDNEPSEDATADPGPSDESEEVIPAAAERRPSRVNRTWLITIAAVLVILAGAVAGGGYVALRYYQDVRATSRNDATALQLAKDCVSATQAPDTSSMAASEQKIIDCGTDQYRTQALLYSSMLVQAYQAANVHLQVSNVRAAVERNHPDGTIDVLVALRVKVSNDQAQDQEAGYRLRVKMAPTDGTYKISKLEQVTK